MALDPSLRDPILAAVPRLRAFAMSLWGMCLWGIDYNRGYALGRIGKMLLKRFLTLAVTRPVVGAKVRIMLSYPAIA